MDLRQIDLNLLVIFNQLLRDRRVSSTAEKLGLSQPAVSNALKRLRVLLKDDLFVRTSRGMEPTPYAMHLLEPIAYALGTLENALNQRDAFNPLTSEREFTLSLTDIGEIYFMPTLMEALAQRAPLVRIQTRRHNEGHLRDDMETGQVDIAVGLLPGLTTGFFQRRLFKQRYVCLFRKDHPEASNPITLTQYKTLPRRSGSMDAEKRYSPTNATAGAALRGSGSYLAKLRPDRHRARTLCTTLRGSISIGHIPTACEAA
jgi:DNA-binding transcriptional LysR family regulator